MRQKALRDEQFLAELSSYADEQRKLIEAQCDGFDVDPHARAARRDRAQGDFEFFVRTYFPHYVRSEASAFHRWYYAEVPRRLDMAAGQLIEVSAPRGEAKSTLGTQLTALWCVLTGRKRFIPIVMDSFDQAATMLAAIKVELESNPRLAMDFPDMVGGGRVWNAAVIITRNNVKLQAFGALKKMRGLRHGPHRPDLVLLDDIENDENVESKDQRDKRERWVSKVVLPLGPPEGTMDVLYLNTILHFDSVANRFHKNPRWVRVRFAAIVEWPDRMDLWEQWEERLLNEGEADADAFYESHQAQMNAGAVVSWPTVRPLAALMKIRAGDHRAFDCEYQNDPTNDENAPFANMRFWVQPCRDWVFYGAHDPSLGKQNKSRDPSATGVGGFDREHGVLSVVEAIVARRLVDRQISQIIELQREYQCLVWAFESVQFQELMRQQLVAASARAGVPVPAVPIVPHTDKDMRIESLSPHVGNGLILFNKRHTVFNTQVRHWPDADHDDGPDMLHMLWTLAVSRAGGVPRIRLGKKAQK